jgi:hypothetical protein
MNRYGEDRMNLNRFGKSTEPKKPDKLPLAGTKGWLPPSQRDL